MLGKHILLLRTCQVHSKCINTIGADRFGSMGMNGCISSMCHTGCPLMIAGNACRVLAAFYICNSEQTPPAMTLCTPRAHHGQPQQPVTTALKRHRPAATLATMRQTWVSPLFNHHPGQMLGTTIIVGTLYLVVATRSPCSCCQLLSPAQITTVTNCWTGLYVLLTIQ